MLESSVLQSANLGVGLSKSRTFNVTLRLDYSSAGQAMENNASTGIRSELDTKLRRLLSDILTTSTVLYLHSYPEVPRQAKPPTLFSLNRLHLNRPNRTALFRPLSIKGAHRVERIPMIYCRISQIEV